MEVSLKASEKLTMGTIPTRARNFFPPCFIFYINMYVGLNDESETLTGIVF